MQEGARRSCHLDVVGPALNIELVEGLPRRLRLAFDIAEGGEVMPSDEALRRHLHCLNVQRFGDAPSSATIQSQIRPAIDDAIKIMAPDSGKTRVKRLVNALRIDDRHRVRPQMRVHGIAHRVFMPLFGEIDMTDLAECMHARVSTPRALDADLLPPT